MKNLLLFPAIALLFTACGGDESASPRTKMRNTALENTLLWKVSGKGLKDTSYIFGSINYGDAKAYAYWNDVEKTMQQCAVFAPEYDNDYFFSTGGNFELDESLWTLKDGQELADLFDSTTYQSLRNVVGTDSLWMPGWKQWKPLFLFEIVANRQEFTPADSVSFDLFINRWARQNDLDVVCLESMSEAKQIYSSVDLETQVLVLKNAAQAYEDRDKDAPLLRDHFLTWYLDPDMNKSIFTMPEEVEKYYHSIRDQRTAYFCERLEEMIKEQPTFCAVKAMHVGGAFGMVNYFRDLGYDVEPVNIRVQIPDPLPYLPASEI